MALAVGRRVLGGARAALARPIYSAPWLSVAGPATPQLELLSRRRHGLGTRFAFRAQSGGKELEGEGPIASAAEDEGDSAEQESEAAQAGNPAESEVLDPALDDTTWAYEKAQLRLVSKEVAPPAVWRDPAEWVDLEMERVGLDCSQAEGAGTLKSPWGTRAFPDPDLNVMWPHAALSEHRKRPFVLPRGAQPNQEQQLHDNRERLKALWRFSASHGISWDELDEAYVTFSQSGKQRHDEWRRRSPMTGKVLAAEEKGRAQDRAINYLKKFIPKTGKEGPLELYPSRTRRLASRLYTREKKRWLSPWRPGRLAAHLQQLVAARMLRRETEDRVHGLRPSP